MTEIEKYQNAKISSGYEPDNFGFQENTGIQNYNQMSTALSTEQAKSVGEVQAALTIAQARPRNENAAVVRIRSACQRKSLAEKAEYVFKRGTTKVTGPSIRLAEVLAQKWGNITFGYREIGQGKGYSEVEAFCWDLETNTKATRQFRIRHWRDLKDGGHELTKERDKYEHIASQAMRRVRACILEIIPSDVIELAIEECEKSLKRQDPRSKDDKVRSMITMFDDIGVTLDMLEEYLGHKIQAVNNTQLVQLGKIFNSIIDGIASREEFFKTRGNQPVKPQKEVEPEVEQEQPNVKEEQKVVKSAAPSEPSQPADPDPPKETRRGRPARTEKKTELDAAIEQSAKQIEQEEAAADKPKHPTQVDTDTKKLRPVDPNQKSFFGE